jgi:hypothetical protein
MCNPVRLAAELRECLVVREVAEQADRDERGDETREDDPREEHERQPDSERAEPHDRYLFAGSFFASFAGETL